ncbi:MAG TPA: rhodanese-related sulfurtransferase [Candidatus Paceibacterota bacterium]|nr:rhodanese-related sulfurtransferase [Candidatus Paceibacterota bacterium]
MTHQVLLFYKYVTIEDPAALAEEVRALATRYSLLGRALIAEEGINATLEGETDATEAFVAELLKDKRLKDMKIKRSGGDGAAFHKLKVKVREEIVGTKFPKEIDPRTRTAPHLSAEELKRWYENEEDFVVVDMRNDYEYRSGHFKGSVNPGMTYSRELPEKLPVLEPYKGKKVVTVCTGGVRCEKMSAYLMANGFSDVYQLDNGMHGYMEKYPGQDFAGTLYTFDNRLTMDFGGEREVVGRCHVCEASTENYINCANDFCHLHILVCPSCTENAGAYCSGACRDFVEAKVA